MKVTQQSEPKFIPVVITLETQEEVDILFNLVGKISGVGKGRRMTSQLDEHLEKYCSSEVSYFTGSMVSP
jgi:hypothetical protein